SLRCPWIAFVRGPATLRGVRMPRARADVAAGTTSGEDGRGVDGPCRPQPAELAEAPIKQSADDRHQAQDRPVAPAGVRCREVCEVHSIDPGDRRGHGDDAGPGCKLAGDVRLPLLLEQIARLERGPKNVDEAGA